MRLTPVTRVTATNDIALITLENIPNDLVVIADIFTAIAEEAINIDMISETPPIKGSITLSFSLGAPDLVRVLNVLGHFRKDIPGLRVDVNLGNSKVSLYGEGMRDVPGVAAAFFRLMAENQFEIKLITTSEIDISCLLNDKDVDKAVEHIKMAFDIE